MTAYSIFVNPSHPVIYQNEYKAQFESNRFSEKVRIDPMTCVYRNWPSTRTKGNLAVG